MLGLLFFIIQIVLFYFLTITSDSYLFQIAIFVIMTCYGGGFSSIAPYISDIFGVKDLSKIHGYILTAWAAAGLVGPILIAFIKDLTNSYVTTLNIFVGLFIISLITAIFTKMKLIKKE
jgi:OFA family oxalate/formate antiporter-like MFS transporter